ncbi:DUF4174 domain-containing protein [Ruixingdingia sedimenti]|uniref:DUF4174 domain-containing protein n=1 Tax=Ruixingdingia sedimenti TaxID=3073604 RepID=A0ABU1F5Z6_9RHOB|nr:DUF4174 domain-containing protein [Xinfangfangia sp. LG-4]MDR5652287.1 DUF4174 domain-containing protein [Xinfangfangia sp. LG-4]
MKPAISLILAMLLPLAALAQAAAPADPAAVPAPWAPVEAAGVDLESFHWISRPIVVFADSPQDPLFLQQMKLLAADPAGLIERDVVVIVDTDPAARTPVRQALRPRGFSLVLMDKDGKAMLRKPLPWDAREITRAIDKFPLRRQEMLEQRPSGR